MVTCEPVPSGPPQQHDWQTTRPGDSTCCWQASDTRKRCAAHSPLPACAQCMPAHTPTKLHTACAGSYVVQLSLTGMEENDGSDHPPCAPKIGPCNTLHSLFRGTLWMHEVAAQLSTAGPRNIGGGTHLAQNSQEMVAKTFVERTRVLPAVAQQLPKFEQDFLAQNVCWQPIHVHGCIAVLQLAPVAARRW